VFTSTGEARKGDGSHRRALQHEHHLKQRVVTETSFAAQFLDELLERQVLMRQRVERHPAHALQQLAKRQLTGQPRAQHERVDEKSDERLGLDLIAPRHRRALSVVGSDRLPLRRGSRS